MLDVAPESPPDAYESAEAAQPHGAEQASESAAAELRPDPALTSSSTDVEGPVGQVLVQRCGAGCASAGSPKAGADEGAIEGSTTVQLMRVQRHSATESRTTGDTGPATVADTPLAWAAKRGPPCRSESTGPTAAAAASVAQRHWSADRHSTRVAAEPAAGAAAESVRDSSAAAAPALRDDLDGHLDVLAGAALVGAPVLQAARQAGQAASLQRLSLNPLDWAKKVWNGIKDLGSGALEQARSLGSAALSSATNLGSQVTSAVSAAVAGALSAVADAARSGVAKLGEAARSALQTLGNVARQGLAGAGKVAKSALDGALRLGRSAWDKASAVGRQALDVAMRAGHGVLDAGRSLAARAWTAVKGKVGGLWDGLKAKAGALKNKVMAGAQGLLAKAKAMGGKALEAAQGLAGKIGGSICGAIGKATAWIYGKVAPLAKQAWEWVKANPAKTIAMLLIPGGPLIALGMALQKKMLELAQQVFGPVVKAVAAKAKAAWNTAKEWGTKAFNTAKQWAGKAVDGAKALGSKALTAAGNFGRSVLGKAKDLGARVIGRAREWGAQVTGKAKELGAKVWGKAMELGGKLLGLADSLTGGMASKIKGLADRVLGKASGVLSWVLDRAKGLADRALSSAKALASKVVSKAKDLASRAWDKAKDLGAKVASKAKDFAAGALAKGKEMLARASQTAVDFGKKALQGAKSLAGRALATAKDWGSRAWATAKDWGGKAWNKAKQLGGQAWDWTKKKAGQAWDFAKGIGAKLAPYASQAWEWAKKVGQALGIDKAIAAVVSLKDKAFALAKQGLAYIKNKVLPVVEQLRQARNKVMSYTTAGILCKAVGCAYRGFIPKKGGQDLEAGLDLATDIIPVVSTVKDTCTCLVGENFVTNKPVSGVEQGLACAFAALDIVGYVGSLGSGGAATAGVVGLRAAVKGGVKVGGKLIAKEALEQLIKKGGRELAEKLGKEGLQELVEKLGKEGLQELAEKLGKEEFEKLAKEAAEKGVKGFEGVLEKGAKEGAEGGAKEGAEEAAEGGAKAGDGASLKETASGVAVCVQGLTIQRLLAERLAIQRVVIQRMVVQRAKGKAGDVCALLPKDIPKASKDAITKLINAGGQLPPSLVKDPDLLAKVARDSDAMDGLCTLLKRADGLDAGTQKALVDALAKHGDDLMPMLKNVKDGVNRLNSAEFKQLVTALNQLPAGLEGIGRWTNKLNQSYSTLKGTLGEIQYAAKLQGELAESGKKIAKVADTIGGKEAGDILVVTNKGKLDEILDVKNFDFSKDFYKSAANLEMVADDIAEQVASLARRYSGEYGLAVDKVQNMVTIVLRGSPPKELLDLLDARHVKWRLG